MYAYHIPGLDPRDGLDGLKRHPVGKRIAHAARWQLSAHPAGGALASWVGFPLLLSAYAAPIPTHDGMAFLPPKDWGANPRESLAREPSSAAIPVSLEQGAILVRQVTRAPRARRFAGAPGVGRPMGDLADAAMALWDRIANKEFIAFDDPGLAKVLFLAVAGCYRVTEEALDALGWLTTSDDYKILSAVFGLDPKAGPGAGDTSPSPPPGSSQDHG